MLDMKKLVDSLLEKEELKEIPIETIFNVINSLFSIMNNENVFYKEYL